MITNSIEKVASEIKGGNVVAFKTDTVYGLSSVIDDDNAVDKIFKLKRRYEGKPLIVLVPLKFDISKLIKVNNNILKLTKQFWPGPLTIIGKVNCSVARGVTPYDTLSVRMPNDKVCQRLLSAVGKPITSTSCNLSGQPILTNAASIDKTFDVCVLDGGECTGGIPSTIVDCSGETIKVLREGSIKEADIFNALK